MWSIKMPCGEYLDVPRNFNFEFELNNQVFTSSDSSTLPGTFSFPANLPLTDRNRSLLGFPDLVTAASTQYEHDGVWVYLYSQPLFYGTLIITQATSTQVQVSIVSNPIRDVKNKKLGELTLGGDITVPTLAGFPVWGAHADDIATRPEDFNYAFFPIYHPGHNDYEIDLVDPANFARYFINYFDTTAEEFNVGDPAAVTPFAKLEYVLEQIFADSDAGFSFENAWQTTTELRRIYLFNNRDVRVYTGTGTPQLPLTFRLSNHMPDVTCGDLIRKVAAQWGLGIFTNVFSKKVRLVPIQQVLARPPVHVWTPFMANRPTISMPDDRIYGYNYAQPAELPPGVPAAHTLEVFETTAEYSAALSGLADGYYYIENQHLIVEVRDLGSGPQGVASWLQHRGEYPGDALDDIFDPGIECLTSLLAAGYSTLMSPVSATRWHETTSSSGSTIYEWREVDFPLALMLYRGMQKETPAKVDYPVAQNQVWNSFYDDGTRYDITTLGVAEATAERSLNWFGQYGLYNTAHAALWNIITNGKHVTMQFALPADTLMNFSFENKIRVQNMDYMAKRLRVQRPLGGGLVLVQADLVSVI